jgi:hypothetical protein
LYLKFCLDNFNCIEEERATVSSPYQNGACAKYIPSLGEPFVNVVRGIYSAKFRKQGSQNFCKRVCKVFARSWQSFRTGFAKLSLHTVGKPFTNGHSYLILKIWPQGFTGKSMVYKNIIVWIIIINNGPIQIIKKKKKF